MRRITCPTNCVLALFCVLLWVPTASGQQTSPTVPQPAYGVTVKMIDSVDSSRDPAGKQYRAGLVRPVSMHGGIIAQGSAATVVLVKNESGWSVQISSLVIKDQVTTVTSNSGTVMGAAAQTNIANAANAATGALGGLLGRKPNPLPTVAAVATGERVVLTPGIMLLFDVTISPSNAPAPGAGSAPVSSAANAAPVTPATQPPAAAQPASTAANAAPPPAGKQTPHHCYFEVILPSDPKRTTMYTNGVFYTDEERGWIDFWWSEYIHSTYHITNASVVPQCPPFPEDPARQQSAMSSDETSWKLHNYNIVHVDWKPTKTPPPGESKPSGPEIAFGHRVTNDTPPGALATQSTGGAVPGCGVGARCAQPPVAAQPATQANSSAAGPGGPSQAQKQRETFCSATYSPDSSQMTYYRSGVFQFSGGNPNVPGDFPPTISQAWSNHVVKTYHMPVDIQGNVTPGDFRPSCYNLSADPGGQMTIANLERYWKAVKGQVVYVDWKYVPGQDAPPAESPVGMALSFCYSAENMTPIYFSDIFGTNISARVASLAAHQNVDGYFYQFLKQKYAYKNSSNYPAGCPIFGTTSSAEATKQGLETQWKRANMQIIETGWKWAIPPGTPPDTLLCYCYAYFGPNGGENLAFSDSFWAPLATDLNSLRDDYNKFIKEKYSAQGLSPGCTSADRAQQEDPMKAGGKKIVETGWKPKTFPQQVLRGH